MKDEIEKLPKNTIKIKITIEAEKVSQTREHVIEDMVREAELPGFRKGSAPRAMVEPQLPQAKIRGEIINHLVPQAYDQAVKESLVKPIILPKIEMESFEDGKDLVFSATTCEYPEINLGDYKTHLSNVKGQGPALSGVEGSKVILGPDGLPIQGKETKEGREQEKINQIFETLLATVKAEVSDLLIEDEVGRMLSRLIDQTGRLGLTVDQYLQSSHKSLEDLKKEYRQSAEKSIKLEFILMAIARQEGIKLDEKEISDTINSAPDEESRKNLSQPESRTYVESVLIKNKVIQKLLEYSK